MLSVAIRHDRIIYNWHIAVNKLQMDRVCKSKNVNLLLMKAWTNTQSTRKLVYRNNYQYNQNLSDVAIKPPL